MRLGPGSASSELCPWMPMRLQQVCASQTCSCPVLLLMQINAADPAPLLSHFKQHHILS